MRLASDMPSSIGNTSLSSTSPLVRHKYLTAIIKIMNGMEDALVDEDIWIPGLANGSPCVPEIPRSKFFDKPERSK